MKQSPYWELTNLRRQRTKFILPCDLASVICAPLFQTRDTVHPCKWNSAFAPAKSFHSNNFQRSSLINYVEIQRKTSNGSNWQVTRFHKNNEDTNWTDLKISIPRGSKLPEQIKACLPSLILLTIMFTSYETEDTASPTAQKIQALRHATPIKFRLSVFHSGYRTDDRAVTSCSFVGSHRRFGGTWRLHTGRW
jgi:hypothetical protein